MSLVLIARYFYYPQFSLVPALANTVLPAQGGIWKPKDKRKFYLEGYFCLSEAETAMLSCGELVALAVSDRFWLKTGIEENLWITLANRGVPAVHSRAELVSCRLHLLTSDEIGYTLV
jgi:hypothetical protein